MLFRKNVMFKVNFWVIKEAWTVFKKDILVLIPSNLILNYEKFAKTATSFALVKY